MSAAIALDRIAPGLSSPVMDAQAIFRRVLEAMARPGRIETLEEAPSAPLAGFRAAGGVALTLLDFETPAHLVGDLAAPDLANWLRFHCGCPLVEAPAAASFVFARADQAPAFATLNPGDPKYPDRSATLVLVTSSLTSGPKVRLTGPGVNGEAICAPAGLAPAFWADMQANHALWPLGVDVILADDTRILALPRTTACTLL